MVKLPKNKTNGVWIFPKGLICIEPRFADGSLDVIRVGKAGLSSELGKVKTEDQLTDSFFRHNKGKAGTCQEISDWLTDNGFTIRPRYW